MGGGVSSGETGIEKVDAGWPTSAAMACSNWARCTPDVDGLRLGGFKLRLRLRHFHFGRQPSVIAVGSKVQSLLVGNHGRVQQLLLRVQPTQRKVVGSQLSVNNSAGRFPNPPRWPGRWPWQLER